MIPRQYAMIRRHGDQVRVKISGHARKIPSTRSVMRKVGNTLIPIDAEHLKKGEQFGIIMPCGYSAITWGTCVDELVGDDQVVDRSKKST